MKEWGLVIRVQEGGLRRNAFLAGQVRGHIAIAVVDESIAIEENLSDGELSENANLQEAYNKLCEVAAKDAMSVNLCLKKIAFLELDKENLLVKLYIYIYIYIYT